MNFFQKIKNLLKKDDKTHTYIPKEEIKRERKLSKKKRECCGGSGNCHCDLSFDTSEHDLKHHPRKHISKAERTK